LKHFRRFERKAVVSDATWLNRLASLLDPLFPTIELRTFTSEERDAAIAWASEE